jgi:glycosyltransferase involved in cell wall biosynthesis
MKVSIITISYNSAETIEDTIKSVVSQDYPNIEYIIIDGASKDETLSIVGKYKDKIAKVVSEKDKGIYDAMNKGVENATGDIIGILNSDDYYYDESVISEVVQLFENEKTDGLYADLVYVDRADSDKVIRYWKSGEYQPGKFLKGWMPPHPTFFVKKEVYEKFGLYSTDLRSAADYEFMLRVIHKHNISLSYMPRILTKMRVGGMSNVSLKNRWKANMEDRRAWKINGLKPKWYTLTVKPLSKILQFLNK